MFESYFTGPAALTVNIIKNTESSSLVVQWDEVDDFLTTTFIVTWTSERDHIVNHVTLTEQSSYTITGLTLDTVYTITVTASNTCGGGPEYGTSVSLTTGATSTIFATSTNTMTSMAIATSATITAVNPSTTTIVTADAASSIIAKTASLISTTSSTNPSTIIATTITSPSTFTATNIVMDPISTVHPEANTTDDETSKFLRSCTCDWICKRGVIHTSNFATLMRHKTFMSRQMS